MSAAPDPVCASDGTIAPLVLGAGGRLGRFLAAAWGAEAGPAAGAGAGAGLAPLWQMRAPVGGTRAAAPPGALPPPPAEALIWDVLAAPAPAGLRGRVDAVLCLAGVTQGPPVALAANSALALAALEAARATGARHVFLTSSAAVHGTAAGPNAETDLPVPATPYGQAKLEMEAAARDWCARAGPGAPGLTCLRIGNVAGADALLGAVARARAEGGIVRLDRFADGRGPRRSYIGPVGLAAVLARLIRRAARGEALPEILNLAAPGAVAMADLLEAAGARWGWQPAPATALPELLLDTGRLEGLCPPPPADPAAMVAEWRALTGQAAAAAGTGNGTGNRAGSGQRGVRG